MVRKIDDREEEDAIMAKQGFTASDRRKVEALATARAIKVSECGKVFVITNTTGAYAVTIPSAASCGEGWWCRFVLGAASNTDRTITLGAAGDTAVLVETSTDGAEDVFALSGADPNVLQIEADNDTVGDEVEILVANGTFFCKAVSKS